MAMTEAEAKTKWCPFVRTGLTAGMAVNRHIAGDVDDETRCLGSGCAVWAWMPHLASSRLEERKGACGLVR